MSCNGCRVLRKGCSESCMLRPCIQWIESPESQGHATVFVAKFFGRAGLMSFISSVQENQRPSLFQSLLYEACGRTVNPVHGAVGLLWTGNWHVCQAAVETVLRGGTLRPISEALGGFMLPVSDDTSEIDLGEDQYFRSKALKRKELENLNRLQKPIVADLDLSLTPGCSMKKVMKIGGGGGGFVSQQQRPCTPSMNSEEESGMTSYDSGFVRVREEKKLLNLFL